MSLTSSIATKINYRNPNSIRAKLRKKRIELLLAMIKKVYEAEGQVNIIDIGGIESYWQVVLPQKTLTDYKVHITMVNLPGSDLPVNKKHYKFFQGDGCDLSFFKDNSFHIAHSNSVIEHVGDWKHMVKFAKEASRIAPNLFIQTPYFWFPIEPHFMTPFIHWLPKPVRVNLLLRSDVGVKKRAQSIDDAVRKVERAQLLDKKMFQSLFPDTTIIEEKIAWLTKSLIAIREN